LLDNNLRLYRISTPH